MPAKSKKMVIECPTCGAEHRVDGSLLPQILVCRGCEQKLQITLRGTATIMNESRKRVTRVSGEWTDEGNPTLEEKPCASCRGKGKHQKKAKVSCPTCKGQGCVLASKKMKICPACNGSCVVSKTSSTKCIECEGLGALVYLIKKKIRAVICEKCHGSRVIDKTVPKVHACPNCSGNCKGELKYMSTRMWDLNRRTAVKRKIVHESSGKVCLCPTCKKLVNPYCGICEGDGNVIEYYLFCKNCNGSGRASSPEEVKVECTACHGSGTQVERRTNRDRKKASEIPRIEEGE